MLFYWSWKCAGPAVWAVAAANGSLGFRAWNHGIYSGKLWEVPPRFAISRANRYMIDHVDYIIAYVHFPGRARDLLEYARRREKQGMLQIDCMEVPGDNNTFFA